jgi:hypothetical protein
LLSHGDHLFDFSSITTDLNLSLVALDYGVGSKSADVGIGFKTSEALRAFSRLDVVELSVLAIPEQSMVLGAVNSLDVHAKSHNNLEVLVRRSFISDSNFNGLIRNLNHFEIILHFLLKDGVVKNHNSLGENSTHDVLVSTSPLDLLNTSTAGLEGSLGFPFISGRGTDSGCILAAPHYNVTILGSSSNNAFARVVLNAVDLILEELASEGRLTERQHVVLISLDVEHPNHVLTRDSSHQSGSRPDRV